MAGFWQKVLAQVNPFDGGATFKNPSPKQRSSNSFVRSTGAVAKNLSGFTKKEDDVYASIEKTINQAVKNARSGNYTGGGVLSPQAQKKKLDEALKIQSDFYKMRGKQLSGDNTALNKTLANPILRGGAAYGAGVKRSGEGVLQGAGGIYDVLTPGKGQNRITQFATRNAQGTDKLVKNNSFNAPLYKGGQLTGELAQILLGGKAVGTAGGAVKSSKVGNVINAATKATDSLGELGKAGKVAKFALNPARVANVAGNTILDQGQVAARGQDVNPATIGTSLGLNYGLGGLAEILSKPIKTTASAAKTKATDTVKRVQLRPNEAATLSDLQDVLVGRVKKPSTQSAIIRDARRAADRVGLDVTSGSSADIQNRINAVLEQPQNSRRFFKPLNDSGSVPAPDLGEGKLSKFASRNAKSTGKGKVEQRLQSDQIADALGIPKNQRVPTKDSLDIRLQKQSTLAENLNQRNEVPQPPVIQPKTIAEKPEKAVFMDATNRLLGGKAAKNTENVSIARSLPTMDTGGSLALIDSIEQGSRSGDFGAVPDQIRNILDSKYNELKAAGVDIGYLQDYFPHKWQNESAVRKQWQSLNMRAGIQNPRELPTYAEGIKLGFKPKNEDYRKALQEYLDTADNLIQNRQYMDELRKQGLITEAASQPMGTQVVDAPGLPRPRAYTNPDTGAEVYGNYYATPDVAKQLNKLFGDQSPVGAVEKTFDKSAKAASLMQDFGLSGGIPGTPVNAFTVAQATKEILSGNFKSPLVATMRSFSKGGFSKYIDKNKAYVELMQEQGVPLRSDYNFNTIASELANVSGIEKGTKALNALWGKAFNDPTFKRFMPVLQTEMYKNVYNRALKKYGQEEAAKVAARAIENFYGLPSMASQATRSKVGSDIASTVLFAPKYRESMITFWKNNAKALAPQNWTKAEYRNNLKFVAGALVAAVAYDYVNQQNNGVHIWDNPDGKKDKAKIGSIGGKDVYLPYLSSIATMPRYLGSAAFNTATGNLEQTKKDLSGFLGYGIRPIADVMNNENYFGDQIYSPDASGTDRLKAVGGYLATQYQHPYVREAVRTAQGKNATLAEAASKASELPLRFYDPKYYKYSGEYSPKGKPGEQFTIPQQRERAALKGEIKKIADNLDLSKRQRASFDKLSAVEFNDDGTLKEDNNPFYKVQKYSDLQDDGVFEAMRQKAQINSALNGKPIDPIFNLDGQARRLVLWKKTLPPGTSDPSVKQLYAQDWYQEYRDQETAYYADKRAWNDQMGYKNAPEDHPYPTPSPDVQQAMDFYNKLPKGTGARSDFIRSNPGVWNKMIAQWEAQDQWTNGERSMLGLGPVEDGGGSGYSKYGRKGGGVRLPKLAQVKIGKPKKSPTIRVKKTFSPGVGVGKAKKIKAKDA